MSNYVDCLEKCVCSLGWTSIDVTVFSLCLQKYTRLFVLCEEVLINIYASIFTKSTLKNENVLSVKLRFECFKHFCTVVYCVTYTVMSLVLMIKYHEMFMRKKKHAMN